MTRLLLIGPNPPQLMGEQKIEAAHYRVWQFLAPLVDAGHEILLAGEPDGDGSLLPAEWGGQVQYEPVAYGERGWRKHLQAVHDRFQPAGVLAVNFSHALYATRLQTTAPLWMDIYGDILTIMQAYTFRRQSNRGLATTIGFLRDVLRRGDAFSVCGTPQKHMLVGELAMCGRLDQHTFGYEFAHVVLPAVPTPDPPEKRLARRRERLGALGIGAADFVVLWAGGYNTWTDVETLFAGLSAAMAANPAIHYVSVGANTYEAPDNVYQQLQQMVAASSLRDRFHFLGWRPWTEMADYYLESDLGLNIDALHYETLYGTRTRLVEMIGAGLPVMSTRGSELSYLLEDHQAAACFDVGDAQRLGELIAHLAAAPDRCRALAAAAQAYAQGPLSLAETTRAVCRWAAEPVPAPDGERAVGGRQWGEFSHWARAQVRLALWQFTGKDK